LLSVAATRVSDNAPVRSKWCKFFLSRERDETEQAKAWCIVREELKRLGWTKAELKRRRKGDASKVALTRRLREKTAVSLRWISENPPANARGDSHPLVDSYLFAHSFGNVS
jgi:hypothetical protein